MKTYKKSNIGRDTFCFEQKEIKVGAKIVTFGYIDGKKVYFIERRDIFGNIESSHTHTSLASLKASL